MMNNHMETLEGHTTNIQANIAAMMAHWNINPIGKCKLDDNKHQDHEVEGTSTPGPLTTNNPDGDFEKW
jgi:hypothetical protein